MSNSIATQLVKSAMSAEERAGYIRRLREMDLERLLVAYEVSVFREGRADALSPAENYERAKLELFRAEITRRVNS